MRVIDHRLLQEKRRRKLAKRRIRRLAAALAVVFCIGFVFFYTKRGEAPSELSVGSSALPTGAPKKGILKIYTAQEFRDLYNNFAYPNTETISDKTPITGNQALDERIRYVATQRGYQLRSAPVTNTFVTVSAEMQLQQRAAKPWLDMQTAAQKERVDMSLSAAYRSSEEQLDIFLSRFSPRTARAENVTAGGFDNQIAQTLATTAPPGYSRHHTGYTIDIICDNNIDQVFEKTSCFKWLSADNYKNAKTYGWIPSYPEGTKDQGPEPESWEYVWVGTDTLTE